MSITAIEVRLDNDEGFTLTLFDGRVLKFGWAISHLLNQANASDRRQIVLESDGALVAWPKIGEQWPVTALVAWHAEVERRRRAGVESSDPLRDQPQLRRQPTEPSIAGGRDEPDPELGEILAELLLTDRWGGFSDEELIEIEGALDDANAIELLKDVRAALADREAEVGPRPRAVSREELLERLAAIPDDPPGWRERWAAELLEQARQDAITRAAGALKGMGGSKPELREADDGVEDHHIEVDLDLELSWLVDNVAGIADVLGALPERLAPDERLTWLWTPKTRLRGMHPVEWLSSGWELAPVVELAATLFERRR